MNRDLKQENKIYELENKYIIYFERSNRVYSIDKDRNNIEIESLETLKMARYIEEIRIAYEEASENSDEIAEIFEQMKNKLNYEGASYNINSVSMIISTEDGYNFTVLGDGTLFDKIVLCLNIAEGTIELYKTGYKQNNGDLISYTDDYVITGTTTTNTVKVMEEGTYNITIKDLYIDVSSATGNLCAFNANKGGKTKNCYVNITLKGDNYMRAGGSAAGLGFANATPNINGETTGSTLTIQGDGFLEINGGGLSAAIGSGYTGFDAAAGDANNIIINSGNIIAKTGTNGCPIGGALRRNVNNIIINGGNIKAIASNRFGIGASAGVANQIVINGGNITVTGGEYGGAIGGSQGSGKLTITGGQIQAKSTHMYSSIGYGCSEVEISGGTITANSPKGAGISSDTTGIIKILGGNILANGKEPIGVLDETNTIVEVIPTDGTNNLYLTPIQLKDIITKEKIMSMTTSDNINYGIKDMYTSEDGILYLYLPEGERVITIKINETEYTGTVTTEQSNSVTLLDVK